MSTHIEPRYRMLGVVPQETQQRIARADDGVHRPHLLVRHVAVAAGTVVTVFVPASCSHAAEGHREPEPDPEVAKAPWYFAGLQELLAHFPPMVAGS